MNPEKVFELIKEYFIKEFEIPEEKIELKALLFTDLGLDSIDALDMVGMLESELDVEINEEELKQVETIEDVVNYIMKKLPGSD
ncbi:MAG: acyl carrier protein [bacterium]|nr:acyl carrier protein [bacterium]